MICLDPEPLAHFLGTFAIAFCLSRYGPHRIVRVIAPLVLIGLALLATADHYVLGAILGIVVTARPYLGTHSVG